MTDGDYSPRVRSLFAAPEHAGDADGPSANAARGRARVRLSADVDDGRLKRLAWRVYGCPHLIAAAEAFCRAWEGRDVGELGSFRAAEIVAELGIPVEKKGRILLLEDAIRALHASAS